MKITPAQREEFRSLFQAVLLDEGVFFPSTDGEVDCLYPDLERWIFECLEEVDEPVPPEPETGGEA